MITVRENVEKQRYEISIEDTRVGFAEYRRDGDVLVFPHTEIDSACRGRGLGAQLVREALDDVRSKGLHVEPRCWFVAQFVDEHPEYRDLVA
ncbi:MAG TPA: GNAT family N-acetyltransferase [Acidimicrobiia bacterium]|nr:GNAT family N-acetyltransferase [Acidimicrobiia bacterium]